MDYHLQEFTSINPISKHCLLKYFFMAVINMLCTNGSQTFLPHRSVNLWRRVLITRVDHFLLYKIIVLQ